MLSQDILDGIIKSGNPAHAYLFLGPDKDMMLKCAFWFAKALNCENISNKALPCNDCVSCGKIERFNHPDIKCISAGEGSRQIKIGDIRAVINDAYLKPIEAKKKVYIINDAGLMNEEASNCLLKTLEEPPNNVVIILISANMGSLFATIISRCQVIKFAQGINPDINETEKGLIEEFLNAADAFCTEGLEFVKRPKQEQFRVLDLLLLHYRRVLISQNTDTSAQNILVLMKQLLRAKELLHANVNSKLVAAHILDGITSSKI
ncbi:MAG: DNA polymerase III subunit [Candidatus Omnitrophica bacterium]|nr:DNA polymerase III subunit [Candidatus Omnitrophota bacterium]